MNKTLRCITSLLTKLLLFTQSTYASGYTNGESSTFDWTEIRKEIAESQGIIVVTTASWSSLPGKASVFLRQNDAWQEATRAQVVVGRNGLGWGIGIADFRSIEGPSKREGDGKGPAGVFRLRQSFGQQRSNQKLPHLVISDSHVCVDDIRSQYYNRIIDEKGVVRDWDS